MLDFQKVVTKHHQLLEGKDLALMFVHCGLDYTRKAKENEKKYNMQKYEQKIARLHNPLQDEDCSHCLKKTLPVY
uniref:Uncharacterized protein n=1 Tax=Romanomermis culicivorax TaxID=13658 RepID=A0A915KLS1_ROMCU